MDGPITICGAIASHLAKQNKYEQNKNFLMNFFNKLYTIQYFSTFTAPVNHKIEVPVAPINPDDGCIIENSETTYQIFVIMGLVFASAYTLAALNMERIGARLILCTNKYIFNQIEIIMKIFKDSIRSDAYFI